MLDLETGSAIVQEKGKLMSDPNAPAPLANIPEKANGRKAEPLPLIALVSSSVAIMGVIVLIIMFVQYRSSTNSQISSLKTDWAMTTIRMSLLEQKRIDLTVKSFQNVGGNFCISIESVDPHLSGVTIKGHVLNENATKCTDVKFNVSVGKTKQELNIPEISSGYASKFELYVPDVATEDTKTASVEYESSNVSYLISR
jgi:hypothetical protein